MSKGSRHGRGRLHSVPDAHIDAQPTVHLGDRLREVREECGLTQEQAAVAAGLTRNALVSLENRRFPDPYLSTLLRLMRVYNLTTIEQLLGPIPSRLLASSWEAEGWRGTRQARTR